MGKYLIVGLGNIGAEYCSTRHNIGFRILDAFAADAGVCFEDKRYGYVARCRVKNAQLVLLKPTTYMNLSGMAVRYWMNEENIPVENVLVLVDDLALPLGTLRLRGQGSAGGHNGLKNIAELIGTEKYARLRFGIGSGFSHGAQIDYVLGNFSADEETAIAPKITECGEIIKSFCLQGLARTMNRFNGSQTKPKENPAPAANITNTDKHG